MNLKIADMMRLLFTILLFLCITLPSVNAQTQEELGYDTTESVYKKIMIIPFEEEMYLCGIQSSIAAQSGKSHQEIVRFFRYSIASQLQNKFLYLYSTASLIHMNDTTQDLLRTYASIGYKFEPYEEEVKEEETSKGFKSFTTKIKKKRVKSKEKSKIKNGQLISKKTTQPKFAALKIKQQAIFKYLSEKYFTDLFVFITELDIENDISDQVALANNKYIRHLRAHYAIVDEQGKFLSKGVVSTTFPNTVNDVGQISSKYFPKLADKLMLKLPRKPQPEDTEVDSLEKIRPAKK